MRRRAGNVPMFCAAIVLAVAALAGRVSAAIVQTRDGRSFEGEVSFDRGKLIVKTPREAVQLALEDVRTADLRAIPAAPQRKPSPAGVPPGRGLRAEYFGDADHNELRFVTIDPVVDFDFPSGLCGDPLLSETFSVRWTGFVTPAFSEEYTFYLEVDDGARLIVGGNIVIDRLRSPAGIHAGTLKMKAGQKYELRLEYRNAGGPARCRLSWSSPSRSREIIPPENLWLPGNLVLPSAKILSPRHLSAHPGTQPIALEASVADPDGQVRKVEFYVDGYSVGTVSREPWRLMWTDAAPGRHLIRVRATDNSGLSRLSEPVTIDVTGESGAIPPPWIATTIGRSSTRAGARVADGKFILEARGAGMWFGDEWGKTDSFLLVHQQLPGDGVITARLVSLEGDEGAAGIMVRDGIRGERAPQVLLGFAPGTGITFRRRENHWEQSKATQEKADLPCWLRLSRYGKQFTAWWSTDGTTWRAMGSRDMIMRAGVCAGLAVAGAEQKTVRAVFDNVSVVRGSPSMETTSPGILLRSGSLLVCQIGQMSDSGVKLFRNEELVIYTAQIARVMFRPITVEQARRIEPGRTGVLLSNGDFFDGEFAGMKDGFVRVNSVLFGPRRFHWYNEVLAIVLRDPVPATPRFEVALADGSLLKAKELTISGEKLRAVDESGVCVAIMPRELLTIRAMD